MGKSLDQLQLTDDPFPLHDVDARQTEWYRLAEEIDSILPDYPWAADTLEGIRDSVLQKHYVTEGQRKAVANIRDARPSYGRRGSRRYEGWGR